MIARQRWRFVGRRPAGRAGDVYLVWHCDDRFAGPWWVVREDEWQRMVTR